MEALEEEEVGKLNRLRDVTVPNKLQLLDELIEKTSELMIDEGKPIGAIQVWIKGTRNEFQETFRLFKKSKALINEYNSKTD